MSLKTRLTLLFTGVTALLFSTFSFSLYYTASQNREEEFFKLLEKEALTKAQLVATNAIEPSVLQNIYRNNRKIIHEVEVAVYDTAFNLLYHDAVDVDIVKETPDMLQSIKDMGRLSFYVGDHQAVGLRRVLQGHDYLITAVAYDHYGYTKLRHLRKNALFASAFMLVLFFLSGSFLAGRVLEPVRAITEKAKKISATNLDLRLEVRKRRDELSELAATFNDMLERLERSFDAQKNFVHHLAHELRNPLAALKAELELALQRDRPTEEYRSAIQRALDDAQKMAHIIKSLLDLAKASYDSAALAFKVVRADEVLADAISELQKSNPDYKVEIAIQETLSENSYFLLKANEYLLRTAFFNLIENGCKFSPDHTCRVSLEIIDPALSSYHEQEKNSSKQSSCLVLYFQNFGKLIDPSEQDLIFQPFYRTPSTVKEHTEGFGIGLSLCKKIINLHKGSISVTSDPYSGNIFSVKLPLAF